jgi:hypothetical protein
LTLSTHILNNAFMVKAKRSGGSVEDLKEKVRILLGKQRVRDGTIVGKQNAYTSRLERFTKFSMMIHRITQMDIEATSVSSNHLKELMFRTSKPRVCAGLKTTSGEICTPVEFK